MAVREVEEEGEEEGEVRAPVLGESDEVVLELRGPNVSESHYVSRRSSWRRNLFVLLLRRKRRGGPAITLERQRSPKVSARQQSDHGEISHVLPFSPRVFHSQIAAEEKKTRPHRVARGDTRRLIASRAAVM